MHKTSPHGSTLQMCVYRFDPDDLNAHLDFSEEFYHQREQEAIAQIKGRLMDIDVWARSKKPEAGEPEVEELPEDEVQRKEITRQYHFYEPHDRPQHTSQQ